MKRTLCAVIVVVLVMAAVACSNEPSTTRADSFEPRSAPAATVGDKVKKVPAAKVKAEPADKIKPEAKVTIPAGTKLRVALLDAVSSDKSQAGDQFLASLTDAVVVDGKTVLEQGMKVRGRVVDAEESGRVKGRAKLELTLTQIVRDEGKSITISTKPYMEVAESTKKRDAGIIGGSAGVGAAIGAIAGGGKGAAIGAAVGGGAGTGTVLATKGKEIRFGVEHPLSFTLASPIEM